MSNEPYIATEPIRIGYALAHNVGDVVPDENVKLNGWQDSVARRGTKAANAAVPDSATAEPPADGAK